MASSIGSSSLAAIYNLSSPKTTGAGSWAIESVSPAKSEIVNEYIPFSIGEPSKEEKSESLASQLKKATSGLSACAKCGAIFMGESPPAIFTKCGNEAESKEDSTKNQPTAKPYTNSTSSIDGSIGANTTSTANITAIMARP